MKELYISPEIKLLGFLPAESIADLDGRSMDEVLGGEGGGISAVTPDLGDIDISIGL